MIYAYKCAPCNREIDIIKRVSEFDRPENCEQCGSEMQRAFAPQKIHLYGTSVQDARWSPAFNQVVRNDAHERQIAKSRGAIEVGNENVHKHQKPKLQSYDD